MKKLFVLFLLVALVPFTVGCNGLWDFDDDEDAAPTGTLVLSRVFPAGLLAGNLRAAAVTLNFSNLFMNVVRGGVTHRLNHRSHTNTANGVEVEFAAVLPLTTIDSLEGQAVTVEIQIQPEGVTAPVVVVPAAPYTLPTTIVVNTPPADLAATTVVTPESVASITEDLVAIDNTITVSSFKVTAIKFGNATLSSTPTPVAPASTYTFTVETDAAYTNTTVPTWEVTVAHTNGTTKTFKSTDTVSPLAVTYNEGKTIATIVVTPTTAYPINGGVYTIALQKTSAVNGTAALTLPAAVAINVQ